MSPEDDKLVRFLRDYAPSPPSPKVNAEEELFQRLDIEDRARERKRIAPVPAIATGIAALVLLLFGYSRWFKASPTFSGVSDEELETFLLENWRETLDDPGNQLSIPPSATAGRTGAEPHLVYSLYHP